MPTYHTCKHCGRQFIGYGNRPMKFCSRKCSAAFRSALAPKRIATCSWCGKEFHPHGENPGTYCSIKCKSEWQRTQKPVGRDWLYQKYIVEQISANDIAKIVGRDPKRVWEWLQDYGIETRSRGHDSTNWMRQGEPSKFKGMRHKPETIQKLREIAIADGRVPYDPAVGPPFKGKRGPEVPSWKGGVTPERQSFYSTPEWKEAVKAVWKRDNASCQRCGKRSVKGERFKFDIHHIVSFACKRLRCVVDNLVLLCKDCHYWVHSNENTNKEFIKEENKDETIRE